MGLGQVRELLTFRPLQAFEMGSEQLALSRTNLAGWPIFRAEVEIRRATI
jgi:hypothetical protein